MKQDKNKTPFGIGDTVSYEGKNYLVWFAVESHEQVLLIPEPDAFTILEAKDVVLDSRVKDRGEVERAKILTGVAQAAAEEEANGKD
jgi:hypothetical protein